MVILDARPPADYVTEHIAGASSVPFYASEEAVELLPEDTWIVSYCACPHAESDALAEALKAHGFDQVKVLDEGFPAWKEGGHPITSGPLP